MHLLRLPEAILVISFQIFHIFCSNVVFSGDVCMCMCTVRIFLRVQFVRKAKWSRYTFLDNNYDKYHISPHCHEPKFFATYLNLESPITPRRAGKRVCLAPSMSGVRKIKIALLVQSLINRLEIMYKTCIELTWLYSITWHLNLMNDLLLDNIKPTSFSLTNILTQNKQLLFSQFLLISLEIRFKL